MNPRPIVQLDGYSKACLGVIAVLLTVLIVGLWADLPGTGRAIAADPPAKEGFGDSASQRNALLEAQGKTNDKLDELIRLLKSGDAKVQLTESGAKPSGGDDAPKPKTK